MCIGRLRCNAAAKPPYTTLQNLGMSAVNNQSIDRVPIGACFCESSTMRSSMLVWTFWVFFLGSLDVTVGNATFKSGQTWRCGLWFLRELNSVSETVGKSHA